MMMRPTMKRTKKTSQKKKKKKKRTSVAEVTWFLIQAFLLSMIPIRRINVDKMRISNESQFHPMKRMKPSQNSKRPKQTQLVQTRLISIIQIISAVPTSPPNRRLLICLDNPSLITNLK